MLEENSWASSRDLQSLISIDSKNNGGIFLQTSSEERLLLAHALVFNQIYGHKLCSFKQSLTQTTASAPLECIKIPQKGKYLIDPHLGLEGITTCYSDLTGLSEYHKSKLQFLCTVEGYRVKHTGLGSIAVGILAVSLLIVALIASCLAAYCCYKQRRARQLQQQ